jgi:co-chaperonin GroES (HSP10)
MAIGLKSNINAIKVKGLRAVADKVLVHNMHFGGQTLASGIILRDDDKKSEGIKPRWAQVYSIGPRAKIDVKSDNMFLLDMAVGHVVLTSKTKTVLQQSEQLILKTVC